MKTLEFHRDDAKDQVRVLCADGMVSVYTRCGYCRHCAGVRVGKRTIPTPQRQVLSGTGRGAGMDEDLLNAATMFKHSSGTAPRSSVRMTREGFRSM